nr:hypothetical protein [Tanacetum cinerariifolium]
MNQNEFEPNHFSFDQPLQYSIIDQEWISKLNNDFMESMRFMFEEFHEQQQVVNLSTHTFEPSRRFNSIYYDDDDDDEEKTIPLRDIISQLPLSIVITTSPPILPIEDPKDSLIMRNEDLSTIPKKESDEFTKSSIEDLISIPSYDDESLSDKNVSKENVKIYSNPLFEFDDKYISSDVNPLFDEVLEDIECKDSYDFNLDESTFLVIPLFDSNEDEYFVPGDDVELLLYHDLSTPKMSVVSILECFTDEPPLKKNDDLFDLGSKENKWKKILYNASIDDLMTDDKIFNTEIHEKSFSPTYVSLPFTDHPYLFFIYVVWILLLYFNYLVVSPFLLSSGCEDIFFTPASPPFIFLIRVELS